MIEIKNTIAPFVLAACAMLAGCSAYAREESTSATEEATLPPLPPFTTEGLTLDNNADTDHVAGRFERDGAAIVFTIDRDRAHDVRHAIFRRPSGEQLFESTLTAGVDVSRFLGGKGSATIVDGEISSREGDPTALDAFLALPEAGLIPQLKGALDAAGIDRDLHRVNIAKDAPHVGAGNVAPRVLQSCGLNPFPSPLPDGYWRWVAPGCELTFFAGMWGTATDINVNGPHRLYLVFAGTVSEVSGGFGLWVYRRYWFGNVRITVGGNGFSPLTPIQVR